MVLVLWHVQQTAAFRGRIVTTNMQAPFYIPAHIFLQVPAPGFGVELLMDKHGQMFLLYNGIHVRQWPQKTIIFSAFSSTRFIILPITAAAGRSFSSYRRI